MKPRGKYKRVLSGII